MAKTNTFFDEMISDKDEIRSIYSAYSQWLKDTSSIQGLTVNSTLWQTIKILVTTNPDGKNTLK